VIRCLAERRGNQWQAFTLELGLATQADTLPEAKEKLESMIDHSFMMRWRATIATTHMNS